MDQGERPDRTPGYVRDDRDGLEVSLELDRNVHDAARRHGPAVQQPEFGRRRFADEPCLEARMTPRLELHASVTVSAVRPGFTRRQALPEFPRDVADPISRAAGNAASTRRYRAVPVRPVQARRTASAFLPCLARRARRQRPHGWCGSIKDIRHLDQIAASGVGHVPRLVSRHLVARIGADERAQCDQLNRSSKDKWNLFRRGHSSSPPKQGRARPSVLPLLAAGAMSVTSVTASGQRPGPERRSANG